MERKYCLLLSFLVPVVVRAIPEIVSFPWPIGYDTVYLYAPFIHYCQIYGLFPMLYYYIFVNPVSITFLFLIGSLGVLSGVDPFLILKLVTPIVNGFLGLSTYYFLTYYLGWGDKKGLICAILCASYFVTLRITWDLLRNTLGLVFFFLAVTPTKSLEKGKNGFLFVLFSLLCLFSHELVGVQLLCVVAYLMFWEIFPSFNISKFLGSVKFYLESKIESLGSRATADSERSDNDVGKERKLKKSNNQVGEEGSEQYQKMFGARIRPLILSMYTFVAICSVLTVLYYAGYFQVKIPTDLASLGRSSLFVDYISLGFGEWIYPSVDILRSDIFSLFLICFIPILPFVIGGYFRNHVLDITTLFLLVGSFMPVVVPHFALPWWYRWMLLLTFPFTIYACNYLLPDKQDPFLVRKLKIPRKHRQIAFVLLLPILILLSSAYMVLPPERALTYFSAINLQTYFPSSMQYNTIPLYYCPYAILACEWLEWNMPSNSCVIVHQGLYGWAALTLNFKPIIPYRYEVKFFTDVILAKALKEAASYNTTYVLTLPPSNYFHNSGDFELVFRLGPIEVFKSST
ncbi:MAG: hypothetical protein ACUVXA_19645 [Candidatus Jordarchaeum sp.]|uniref:hypothetical protein n=1 Tax=Candidatus Jordarchaeum sp. TaxID=2823881 RepID=UPI00404959A7